jgi:succinoglycan biosynthesis protein ExoW
MEPTVAVVIPFFQKTAGVLLRAVESVLAQTFQHYHVLVVDDGSPIHARTELRQYIDSNDTRLTIIDQENAGPGAARNRGIDHAPQSAKFIAFLDSDDEWMPDHLERAVEALDHGYDFYFSDFYFPDYKKQSAFIRGGKIPLALHEPVAGTTSLYAFRGSMLDQILITGNVIGTSTVVYRYDFCRKQRFNEKFFNGQDYLFWLEFFAGGANAVFSPIAGADYGLGVNIFSGAGWDTTRSLDRLCNELALWQLVAKTYCVTAAQETALRKKINGIRQSITMDILHRVTNRRPVERRQIVRLLREDSSMLVRFPISTIRLLLDRAAAGDFRHHSSAKHCKELEK